MTTTPNPTAEGIVYQALKGITGAVQKTDEVITALRAAGLLRARLERTEGGYLLADPVADTIARVVGIPCDWQQVQDIAAAFQAEGLLADPTRVGASEGTSNSGPPPLAPSEEQIERAARAMEDHYDRWSGPSEEPPTYADLAEAALAAVGVAPQEPTDEEEIVAKVLDELEEARKTADDGGWGTTFHRHGISNEIHRGVDECDHPGRKRQVYVFDPDYLAEHDEWVVLATLRAAAGVAPSVSPTVTDDADEHNDSQEGEAEHEDHASTVTGATAPVSDREKLNADAKRRAKKRRDAGWLVEADMLDRLIDALAAQPVLDPEKVADLLCSTMRHTGDRECEYDIETARALCEAAKRGELT